MVVNLSAESVALVRLELGYDQSGEAVAGVPALSPRPTVPPDPPESALLAVPATVTPPKAEPHQ